MLLFSFDCVGGVGVGVDVGDGGSSSVVVGGGGGDAVDGIFTSTI